MGLRRAHLNPAVCYETSFPPLNATPSCVEFVEKPLDVCIWPQIGNTKKSPEGGLLPGKNPEN